MRLLDGGDIGDFPTFIFRLGFPFSGALFFEEPLAGSLGEAPLSGSLGEAPLAGSLGEESFAGALEGERKGWFMWVWRGFGGRGETFLH